MKEFLTEDKVRDKARNVLDFRDSDKAISDVGQLTTFKQLGFSGDKINKKPDGWYLPKAITDVAIILETKNSNESIDNQNHISEIIENCKVISSKYQKRIGILYNGYDVKVFKNEEEVSVANELQDKYYYIRLFEDESIDKEKIYTLSARINNCLHKDFGIKNLYHRMIFTACALVATRYGAVLVKGMNYNTFHTSILSTLNKSLENDKQQNSKLGLLAEVYSEIKMNNNENQDAIDNFISWVQEISGLINSNHWNGEDVMGIFFNEFNRYKKKSESGQVFTPDHITSFMYRLIDVGQDDYILDAACGSGGFLVKAMANMMKESGGYDTAKAKDIRRNHLFGIEFDREIFALACANMLIHKDGKTNLTQLDSRTETACSWIQSKPITKVLMNPPFESKYGCLNIVLNVLDSVAPHTDCAFILPDKKIEKGSKKLIENMLKRHTLKKIIKLPEKTFTEGVTTSIFIFESGVPQNNKEIFACYLEEDGLETVKNQGRHDIKNKWPAIEDKWVDIIHKQSGDKNIQWIKPLEHLSYQMPEKPFEISKEDFKKTAMDYICFKNGIDTKEFGEKLLNAALYGSEVTSDDTGVNIKIGGGKGQPDWDYMESYMKVVMEESEKSLENLKKADDTKHLVDVSEWGEFKVGDLFDKLTLKCRKKDFNKAVDCSEEQTDEFSLPLTNAKHFNNGIQFYGRPDEWDSAEMTIDIVSNGAIATGDVYAQPQRTGVLWDSYLVKCKYDITSELVLQYMACVIQRCVKQYFGWDDKCTWDKVKEQYIKLPITSTGEPDWQYMEDYMKTVIEEAQKRITCFSTL